MSDRAASGKRTTPREQLQEKILADYPRLWSPTTRFKFGCHPGVSCFNQVLRRREHLSVAVRRAADEEALGMNSSEFPGKYALMPVQKDMKTPVVVLRMNDDDSQDLPVPDRQRLRHLLRPALALPDVSAGPGGAEGHAGRLARRAVLLPAEGRGLPRVRGASKEWTVSQWLDDQGIDEYDEWGEAFKELTLHEYFEEGGVLLAREDAHAVHRLLRPG